MWCTDCDRVPPLSFPASLFGCPPCSPFTYVPHVLPARSELAYIPRVPAKEPKREFKVGDKIRVNLHHGKIEDAIVRAVIQDDDGIIKLQVDGVGLDLTALIDTRQVVG